MIHRLILKDQFSGDWLSFEDCCEVVSAQVAKDVLPALEQVQQRVSERQLFGAGFLTYEAASGFDEALVTRLEQAPSLPLLSFGLFKSVRRLNHLDEFESGGSGKEVDPGLSKLTWRFDLTEERYLKTIDQIKSQIGAGNTYQVNFTQRQYSTLDQPVSAWQVFCSFATDAPYAAYVEMEDVAICSASPELFFSADGSRIHCKPMKGTASRGKTQQEDLRAAQSLADSIKDRAENLMIVDMIRNDLGKIAQPGSIKVTDQFAIEKYPTLWQMTSTIEATSDANMAEIFTALFPCASITGAPKVETMKLINELEESPRGIYTGSIGYISPNGQAQFNVAIRTAMLDLPSGELSYGIGGGIVWDSVPEDEYAECLLKSKVIRGGGFNNDFDLLESLLWNPQDQYFLLDYHQRRLRETADYFDYPLNQDQVDKSLSEIAAGFEPLNYKVRLLVNKMGEISVSASVIEPNETSRPRRVKLAADPVSSSHVFLYHKTTERRVYQQAITAEGMGDVDDVILWNERGEITESTIANIVVKINDQLLTPPLSSGLLSGTFRQSLLDQNKIVEQVLYKHDLAQASEIWLINSVRRWQLAALEPQTVLP